MSFDWQLPYFTSGFNKNRRGHSGNCIKLLKFCIGTLNFDAKFKITGKFYVSISDSHLDIFRNYEVLKFDIPNVKFACNSCETDCYLKQNFILKSLLLF